MKPEKKLDNLFNVYIRLRDTKDGGYCVSCGKPIKFDSCDAGHFIPCSFKKLRWDEANVHAQCKTCNEYQRGNIESYRKNLLTKIGAKEVKRLEKQKNEFFQIKDFEILKKIEYYEKKIKEMR